MFKKRLTRTSKNDSVTIYVHTSAIADILIENVRDRFAPSVDADEIAISISERIVKDAFDNVEIEDMYLSPQIGEAQIGNVAGFSVVIAIDVMETRKENIVVLLVLGGIDEIDAADDYMEVICA